MNKNIKLLNVFVAISLFLIVSEAFAGFLVVNAKFISGGSCSSASELVQMLQGTATSPTDTDDKFTHQVVKPQGTRASDDKTDMRKLGISDLSQYDVNYNNYDVNYNNDDSSPSLMELLIEAVVHTMFKEAVTEYLQTGRTSSVITSINMNKVMEYMNMNSPQVSLP